LVIKEYESVLRDFYVAFSASLVPGGPKVLRLNSFIELVTLTGVTSDNFGAREISQLFNISM
jgi:hypothetical protein